MASLSVTVRYPADLLEQIDAVAGVGKRTEWVIRAARAALAPEAFAAQLRAEVVAAGFTPAPPGDSIVVSYERAREVSPRFRDPKAGRL